jgi:anti-sigma regulatory factor (Ser/Thr protein kinase)
VEVIESLDSSIALPIEDASQVGEARRTAATLASRLGFDETASGRVSLVVTEMATNLLKHAGRGEVLLRPLWAGEAAGLDVLALDRGAGMADVDRCLADGFSTAGSPGHGLGAIGRLSSLFDVYSQPGVGTGVLSRIWAGEAPAEELPRRLDVGVVCLPVAGETACGDAWAVEDLPGRAVVMVADGLGHGPQAAEASATAVRIFREAAALGPVEAIRAIHAALRSTRGAAVAIAEVSGDPPGVRYAGVGNIAAAVLSPEGPGRAHRMVSHNGTVGHEVRKVQEFSYPWPVGALLVMHSDGLATHWSVDRYAGLAMRHPALIAGILYRDHRRVRDDVTALVARGKATS